jgi:hypothetical protein
MRRFERLGEHFAILNDMAQNYSLLTAYVTPSWQRAQLAKLGFRGDVFTFNPGGKLVEEDAACCWIYYVVTKEPLQLTSGGKAAHAQGWPHECSE